MTPDLTFMNNARVSWKHQFPHAAIDHDPAEIVTPAIC